MIVIYFYKIFKFIIAIESWITDVDHSYELERQQINDESSMNYLPSIPLMLEIIKILLIKK